MDEWKLVNVQPHTTKTVLSGPPSITVSALSRDTLSVEGFDFPFVEVLFWLLLLLLLIAT